jgi:hypothetical protein
MKWLANSAYWTAAVLIALLVLHGPLWAGSPEGAAWALNPGMVAPQLREASFLAGVLLLANVYRNAWLGWRN